MSTILDTIIAEKAKEVAARKLIKPQQIVEAELAQSSLPLHALKSSLLQGNTSGIIAEFKRRSPSKGLINGHSTVEEVTKAYYEHGAAAVSVLTDQVFFGGSMEDMAAATTALPIPVLRKDFIIDPYQLFEARLGGASVILLIAACLSVQQTKELARTAKSLGLEVLLEIHEASELGHICEEVDMVGVNNRNLKDFSVDINRSINLLEGIPTDKPAIAESGINNTDTIVTLRAAGFRGFLMGEHFMKQQTPAIAFANFIAELNAKQYAR